MFIRLGTESHEVYIDEKDILCFGRFQQPILAMPQSIPLSNGAQFALRNPPSTTPQWEYWARIRGSEQNSDNRITCSEQDYLTLIELLAPGGGELYDESIRQNSGSANSSGSVGGGVAGMAEPSRETQIQDSKDSH